MVQMINGIMLFIVLIIGLYIGTLVLNKKTIDDYSNMNERDKNLNNLRGLLWASYITITVITIYLLIKMFSKTGFYYNKSIFVITILILLVNTALIIHEEYILKDLLIKINTEHNLNNIYVMSTIMTVINVISLLSLIYTNENSKIYKPDYQTINYEYTEESGKILSSLLDINKPIRPTKNVSYENVFQNKSNKISNSLKKSKPVTKSKNKSLNPNKSIFQGAIQDSYVNPLLLQNKKSDVYVNPILL